MEEDDFEFCFAWPPCLCITMTWVWASVSLTKFVPTTSSHLGCKHAFLKSASGPIFFSEFFCILRLLQLFLCRTSSSAFWLHLLPSVGQNAVSCRSNKQTLTCPLCYSEVRYLTIKMSVRITNYSFLRKWTRYYVGDCGTTWLFGCWAKMVDTFQRPMYGRENITISSLSLWISYINHNHKDNKIIKIIDGRYVGERISQWGQHRNWQTL